MLRTLAPSAIEWLLLIATLGYFFCITLPRAWNAVNTDFPNYYIAAHMLRNGENTDRIYEWAEMQRHKDQLEIDQPVVGFIPLTPVSALSFVPFAKLPPLTAKRYWTVTNLALMALVVALLCSLTRLHWRRVALLAALTLPIHHNLILGQAYILLLAVLTLALWAYVRNRSITSGLIIAIAFGLKIFPLLFLLHFIRKRDWKAVTGLVVGSGAIILLSIVVFGVEMNRTYALQVLPWALRGEALDPYNLHAGSISALLHRAFVYEPEWNPHPLFAAPVVLAIMHPFIQLLIFAPVLLLTSACREENKRTQLEWSVFTVALLAISTSPAYYDFTILLMPAAVITATLIERQRWSALALFYLIYLGICYPFKLQYMPSFIVPRLYLVILLCALGCTLLNADVSRLAVLPYRRSWIAAFALGLAFAITLNIWHQRGIYDSYRWRVLVGRNILALSHPVPLASETLFTAMLEGGYRSGEITSKGIRLSASTVDHLSQTANTKRRWTEEVGRHSRVVSALALDRPRQTEIDDAASPVLSPNGEWLAFRRFEKGSARLWLKSLADSSEFPITQTGIDVMESSFFPDNTIVFSATVWGLPHLYIGDRYGNFRLLTNDETRYPAVSPDGRWLAFSQLQRGNWNLQLRDMMTGKVQALTNAQCNNIEPAWAADSKTLFYASDCGRGLWLTALCRRRVLP